MASHALVLSIDPHSSTLVREVLKEFDVKADLCLSANSAKRMLKQNSYSSVIVDCESVPDSFSVFHELRNNRENRGAVTVTLLRDDAQMRAAAEVGSTFVLHKPVPAEDARRIMRIANHLLARDSVRRYIRLPLSNLAFALLNEQQQIVVENVSLGGMAIQAEEHLEMGSTCTVSFTLPDGEAVIAAEALVKWSDASGRAGLQFTNMAPAMHKQLDEWIESAYESGLPDIDGNRRVVLDVPAKMVQRRPWAKRAAAIASAVVVDAAVAIIATSMFAVLARWTIDQWLPWTRLWQPALLFAAGYHYLFVAHQQKTLGAMVAARVAEVE